MIHFDSLAALARQAFAQYYLQTRLQIHVIGLPSLASWRVHKGKGYVKGESKRVFHFAHMDSEDAEG